MPAQQDAVHVIPVHLLLLVHRFLVGQAEGLVVKAHVRPGLHLLLLLLHQGAGGQVQQTADLPLPAAVELLPLQVLLRRLGGVHPQPVPHKALLLDLAHAGLPAGAVLAGKLLHAPAHQQADHLRRQGQIVVEGVQALEIRRGQNLAQPPLHLVHQAGEGGGLVLQLPGDVGGGVLRRAGGGFRRGGLRRTDGAVRQAQGDQGPPPLLQSAPVPVEGLAGRRGVQLPAPAQQVQVEQGRVPVSPGHQPLRRPGRHGYDLSGQQQLRHGNSPFQRYCRFMIIPQKGGIVKWDRIAGDGAAVHQLPQGPRRRKLAGSRFHCRVPPHKNKKRAAFNRIYPVNAARYGSYFAQCRRRFCKGRFAQIRAGMWKTP